MLRSLIVGIAVVGVVHALARVGLAQGTATKSFSHDGEVGEIVAWIDNKQDETSPTGLTDWENVNISSTASDSVAIYRLVTNVDIDLTASTADVLVHGTSWEPLATYYKITSDGDGSTTTGFESKENGDGVGSFVYVGGGSTDWETLNGETAGTFLLGGKTITHAELDGQVLLTITVRGLNGEDLGTDSDLTEAPDSGTTSDYVASLTLLAVGMP